MVVNDSDDRTREFLLESQSRMPERVFVLGCGLNAPAASCRCRARCNTARTRRIHKMVHLRNLYWHRERLSTYDFTIAVDCDLRSYLYLDGLWNSAYWFRERPEIDAITSNGLMVMSATPTTSTLIYQDSYAHKDKEMQEDGRPYNHVRELLSGRPYGSKLLRVRSAFGDFTIYRTHSFLTGPYVLQMIKSKSHEALCEHVPFHRRMPHVYLNGSMLHVITDNSDRYESEYSNMRA